MKPQLSERVKKRDFPGEFLEVILSAASDPSTISFAGGLPNPTTLPVEEVSEASKKVFEKFGYVALQYSQAQGFLPLRQKIADRYKKTMGIEYSADDIIITAGSQQALDLVAASLVDPGDEIVVENPSYLAALQVFHHYDPKVLTVDLNEDGLDVEQLVELLKDHNPKFMYIIPNFQNPTGLTYKEETRAALAEALKGTDTVLLEDNPYGELRFTGKSGNSLAYYLGEQCCALGTFSKIVSPGMRIGWIACPNKELRDKLVMYKSALDLHTNIFGQMLMDQYLEDNDLDEQIRKAAAVYGEKANRMMACMEKYLPEGVEFTRPEGGMFLWVTLPEGVKAVDVQNAALKRKVAVVAGDPFYEYERDVRTMRINYSNSSDEQMEEGMKILGEVMAEYIK
ncbi:MAG: PLP-dependent aminotransferase family protein [Anaerovoracaceae bacterium]|nr:PLP-dependent aminotransferase family protein [Bacillota bacterium]